MNYWNMILLIGLFVLSSSCEKEDLANTGEDDFLVFGHFYGFCVGETCIEIFKVNDKNLWEDVNDIYPERDQFYLADYKVLDQNLFEEVRDLKTFFPDSLWLENEKVIGMPDAGDWGGFYIEYQKDKVRKFWIIDKLQLNVPKYLHPFLDKVDEKIALINK